MALIEEFEKTGNWLFRWRSYLPLAILGLCLGCMPYYNYPENSEKADHLWEVFCLIVSFTGLGVRIFTIGYTPSGTSGRNTKAQIADELNTKGLYSVVRNPLYLGNFFMYLGIALFLHNWWLLVSFILTFWLYYERIIFAEEAFLRNKFGIEYLQWARKVPLFCPRFNGYEKPALPFSFKNVLKREYSGFLGVVLTMFLLETTGELVVNKKLEFDTGWIIFLTMSFLVWLTLRTLKKKTTVLHVAGR